MCVFRHAFYINVTYIFILQYMECTYTVYLYIHMFISILSIYIYIGVRAPLQVDMATRRGDVSEHDKKKDKKDKHKKEKKEKKERRSRSSSSGREGFLEEGRPDPAPAPPPPVAGARVSLGASEVPPPTRRTRRSLQQRLPSHLLWLPRRRWWRSLWVPRTRGAQLSRPALRQEPQKRKSGQGKNKKSWVCRDCGRAFHNESGLDQHRQWNHTCVVWRLFNNSRNRDEARKPSSPSPPPEKGPKRRRSIGVDATGPSMRALSCARPGCLSGCRLQLQGPWVLRMKQPAWLAEKQPMRPGGLLL